MEWLDSSQLDHCPRATAPATDVGKSGRLVSVTNSSKTHPGPGHGGVREGAGRKAAYGEATTTLRVPVSAKGQVVDFLQRLKESRAAARDDALIADFRYPDPEPPGLELPVGLSRVSAGFPSPAEDYEDRRLDINQYLVARPSSTFFFEVKGVSMREFGILDGDLLVCDRSLQARHGDLVVAFVNGERLVKQLFSRAGRVRLVAGNPDYPPLEILEGMEFEIWGVVIGRFGRVDTLKKGP